MSQSCEIILKEISDVINGKVVQEDDTFYIVKNDGRKIDFSLEAEGMRKLGLLWKLIRNGLLEKNSVLLWDEPEANLNPELYPLVANILLALRMVCRFFLQHIVIILLNIWKLEERRRNRYLFTICIEMIWEKK